MEVEPIWAALLAKALEGKDVKELLSNVGSGGGVPAGDVAAAIGGAPAEAATEAKEEKKEEEKEESDDDMVRVMFLFLLCFPSCPMILPCPGGAFCSTHHSLTTSVQSGIWFVRLIFAVRVWSPVSALHITFIISRCCMPIHTANNHVNSAIFPSYAHLHSHLAVVMFHIFFHLTPSSATQGPLEGAGYEPHFVYYIPFGLLAVSCPCRGGRTYLHRRDSKSASVQTASTQSSDLLRPLVHINLLFSPQPH